MEQPPTQGTHGDENADDDFQDAQVQPDQTRASPEPAPAQQFFQPASPQGYFMPPMPGYTGPAPPGAPQFYAASQGMPVPYMATPRGGMPMQMPPPQVQQAQMQQKMFAEMQTAIKQGQQQSQQFMEFMQNQQAEMSSQFRSFRDHTEEALQATARENKARVESESERLRESVAAVEERIKSVSFSASSPPEPSEFPETVPAMPSDNRRRTLPGISDKAFTAINGPPKYLTNGDSLTATFNNNVTEDINQFSFE